jgi:tRNA G18 (ribose-2'-O)-methylase SpoU
MAELIPIADADDPRVAAYRDIRERDLVGRQGQFIAEGEVVLRVLAEHRGDLVQSLLIDGRRLEKLSSILAALPEATPVYVTEQGALDAIAGFHLHRGLLALGQKPADPGAAALLASAGNGPVLAMMGIANHDNMGGLFRNAAAFGVKAALLAPDCCDPFYRKALRVSVGGVLRVPFATLAPEEDLVAALERQDFTQRGRRPCTSSSRRAGPP